MQLSASRFLLLPDFASFLIDLEHEIINEMK